VIKRFFNKCSGVVYMYPRGAGPNLSDSCGTPRVGELHLLLRSTSFSIDPGSSGRSIEVGIQGSQTNPGEANWDKRNSMECVNAIVTVGKPLRQVGISKVFQEVEKRELGKIWSQFFLQG
jgi:hypothetical protein